MQIPVYVLNLPDEYSRFEEIDKQASALGVAEVTRVEAVRGGLIPDAACRILTRNRWSVNHKGTLGCFLSHLRAWELVSAGGAEFGLVVEDDVELQNISKLKNCELPNDCDLLWCNDRTAYPGDGVSMLRPIFPALPFVEQHGRAIGGDCYLLSKHAAKSLLSFIEIDGLFSHVDLRLMAYAVKPEQAELMRNAGKISKNVADLRSTYSASHTLNSYSFWPSIGRHLSIPSRRDQQDRLGERRVE